MSSEVHVGQPHQLIDVVRAPLECQLKYADFEVVDNAKCKDFADEQSQQLLQSGPWELNFPLWNVTSLGNVTYMSVYAPTELQRQLFCDVRTRYLMWAEQQYRRHWYYVLAGVCMGALLGWLVGWRC